MLVGMTMMTMMMMMMMMMIIIIIMSFTLPFSSAALH